MTSQGADLLDSLKTIKGKDMRVQDVYHYIILMCYLKSCRKIYWCVFSTAECKLDCLSSGCSFFLNFLCSTLG